MHLSATVETWYSSEERLVAEQRSVTQLKLLLEQILSIIRGHMVGTPCQLVSPPDKSQLVDHYMWNLTLMVQFDFFFFITR